MNLAMMTPFSGEKWRKILSGSTWNHSKEKMFKCSPNFNEGNYILTKTLESN